MITFSKYFLNIVYVINIECIKNVITNPQWVIPLPKTACRHFRFEINQLLSSSKIKLSRVSTEKNILSQETVLRYTESVYITKPNTGTQTTIHQKKTKQLKRKVAAIPHR